MNSSEMEEPKELMGERDEPTEEAQIAAAYIWTNFVSVGRWDAEKVAKAIEIIMEQKCTCPRRGRSMWEDVPALKELGTSLINACPIHGQERLDVMDDPNINAYERSLRPRCQESNPEVGQCELPELHEGKHLAGYLMWGTEEPISTLSFELRAKGQGLLILEDILKGLEYAEEGRTNTIKPDLLGNYLNRIIRERQEKVVERLDEQWKQRCRVLMGDVDKLKKALQEHEA